MVNKIKNHPLARQASASMLLKYFQMGMSFLIMILLTKNLSKSDVGIYSFYLAVVAIASLPVVSGISSYIMRETAKNREDVSKVNFTGKSFGVYVLIVLVSSCKCNRYRFVEKYFDEKICEHYNLRQIKLVEGLLFSSMIPLHFDNYKRQLIMYGKAMELLNQVMES